jgi:hypothetical protein
MARKKKANVDQHLVVSDADAATVQLDKVDARIILATVADMRTEVAHSNVGTPDAQAHGETRTISVPSSRLALGQRKRYPRMCPCGRYHTPSASKPNERRCATCRSKKGGRK